MPEMPAPTIRTSKWLGFTLTSSRRRGHDTLKLQVEEKLPGQLDVVVAAQSLEDRIHRVAARKLPERVVEVLAQEERIVTAVGRDPDAACARHDAHVGGKDE